MGRRVIRGLKTRVGRECSISRLYSKDIHVRGVQGGSHTVTSRDAAGGSSKSDSWKEF